MASSTSPPAAEGYRMALRYIKALFLQEQYRQCIQTCRETLNIAGDDVNQHPLQRLYINFYLGSSYDAIARCMHHNSVAKLPAFNSAEQHYLDALESLLTPEQVQLLCTRQPMHDEADPFMDEKAPTEVPEDYFNPSSCRTSSIWLSSPPRMGGETVPDESPMNSPAPTISDSEEFESHNNFPDFATPKRMQRDFSRMSLLESSPRVNRLSRDVSRMSLIDMTAPQRQQSISRGLMRPIRLGSPARTFHLPPALSYSGTNTQLSSRLPQYCGQARETPALTGAEAAQAIRQSPEPVSPIPRKSSEEFSDSLTLSPVSPQTPTQYRQVTVGSPVSPLEESRFDEPAFLRLSDQLEAMRAQITTHLQLVQNVKEQLGHFQAERKAKADAVRRGLTIDASVTSLHASKDALSSPPLTALKSPKAKPIQQSRSYWSFAPEDVKATEKKHRIEAGRARNWERKRFDPTRYQVLCEQALAEL